MRLNKYLALCGVGSRRKCDELIQGEQILVNGEIAHIGQEVNGTEKITINGREIKQNNEYYYYILNKPKGCICTMQDDRGRRTIIDVFNKAYYKKHKNTQPPHLFPVGRLDYNTQGLLILTNDGDLINELTHPSVKVPKVYIVSIDSVIHQHELEQMANGIEIEPGKTAYADITVLEADKNHTLMQITLYQGMNRQIRKMFEYFGYEVKTLKRVQHAIINLDGMKRGEFKPIKPKQIKELKNFLNRIKKDD